MIEQGSVAAAWVIYTISPAGAMALIEQLAA
jgi:hypothetical protein